jgi:thiamine biosynthesis lipoprotein
MATRFEVVLHGENPVSLRAAGEEALDEIERLEGQLSLFRPTSELARVNRQAAEQPVRVSPPVFRLLERAQGLARETSGAFDPTVGPLVRCYGFHGETGGGRNAEGLAAARDCVGMDQVALDADSFTVRFRRKGMMLDLGAIGKGYAIECAVETLREAGVASAFIHGGTSTCYGLGVPGDAESWKAAVSGPPPDQPAETAQASASFPLATVPLRDESLSVSALWGRCCQAGERLLGHVIDPRSGEPVQRAAMAGVVAASATETDALSTALLVLGVEGVDLLGRLRPGARAFVGALVEGSPELRFVARGIAFRPSGQA